MTQASKTPAPAQLTRALVPIWAIGAALRLGFVWLEPKTSPIADETMWLMALNRIPAANFSPFSNYPIFHPPLYPYFLAAVSTVFGSLLAVKVVQALIGSLLVPAVFRIAASVFGPRTAVLASAFVAFYPELVWYSAHFWCETLFLSLFWWAIERVLAADEASSLRAAASAGVLFGLAVLTRETVLYLLPLAVLWLARSEARNRGSLAIASFFAAFFVVAPWTIRNGVQFKAFIPVSTGGALNLYQGNADLSRGEVYNEYYTNEGKVEQYLWARSEGIKAIWKRQPGWFFEKVRDEGPKLAELDSLALIHMRRGAYLNVSCDSYRAAAFILLVPWVLIAAGSVLALARITLNLKSVLLVGFLIAYALLHIATHGFSRYRLPMLPGFMILAASLVEFERSAPRSRAGRTLLLVLVLALALLWTPSLVDQFGHLGFGASPGYEGFEPVCPA